jgi:PiT family inorganic phosphate transporter
VITTYLVIIVIAALVFDFINGFHDAANSIATIVSTRVLSPRAAVIWAAFFNFIAFLVFPATVSASIAKGVDADAITNNVIFGTLIGAISWNLITWYYGLPSSSSHALMGAFAGSALSHTPDLSVLDFGVFGKTVLFIVLAPTMGLIVGFGIMKLMRTLLRNASPGKIDKWFRRGQLLSAALYSLGHGGNDAQKTMGIITALLITANVQAAPAEGESSEPLLWVVLACHAAMGLGTLSGGWRIVKTMGMKITKLRPVGGFCAETSGAITLAMAIFLGVPVSTTHTITGSIVGVGAGERRLSAVRWGVAGRILWAWVLTIPAAAIISAASYFVIQFLTGQK